MPLNIRYIIGSTDTYFRIDKLNVFLFYAKNINNDLAAKLYFSLNKQITYNLHYHIHSGALNSFDDMPAYFDINYLEESIEFITNQVIPSLQNERSNMWEKHGGFDSLKNQINNGNKNDWNFNLSLKDEYVQENMVYYIDIAVEIKDLLQKSLIFNTPLMVIYED